MKMIVKFSVLTLVILGITHIGGYARTKNNDQTLSMTQKEAQITFFKQALDELGATSPEQVIDLWIKAYQTRNGVYQYAVATKELKEEISETWGEPEDSFYNIVGSSPWLDTYEIIEQSRVDETICKVTISYNWTDSSDPTYSTTEVLTLVKIEEIWSVSEVKPHIWSYE